MESHGEILFSFGGAEESNPPVAVSISGTSPMKLVMSFAWRSTCSIRRLFSRVTSFNCF
jgi:hypothetical protein